MADKPTRFARRTLALPGIAALVLGLGACGGGTHSVRSKVENALAHEGGKTICDGSCKSFHTKSATCAAPGRLVGSFSFYGCRVFYDNDGPPDRVCAGLNGSKLVYRPLKACNP